MRARKEGTSREWRGIFILELPKEKKNVSFELRRTTEHKGGTYAFFLERRKVFWSKLQMVWSRKDEAEQLDTQLVSLDRSLFGCVHWTTYLSHLIFLVFL